MDKGTTTAELKLLKANLLVCIKLPDKHEFAMQLKGGPVHRSMRRLGFEWLRRKQVSCPNQCAVYPEDMYCPLQVDCVFTLEHFAHKGVMYFDGLWISHKTACCGLVVCSVSHVSRAKLQ